MRKNQAYYFSLEKETEDICRTDRELLINCCGLVVFEHPFQSHQQKGRKDFYLQYVVAGEMDIWLPTGPRVFAAGQVILHHPHTPYRYSMRGKTPVEYYWVHFTGGQALALVDQCHFDNQAVITVGLDEGIQGQFDTIFREFITREDSFYFIAESMLIQLLVKIRRRAERFAQGGTPTGRQIYRSLTHIHTNYNKPLPVDALAEREHLSVSRFCSLFKENTGISPLNYIISLRMQHAKELLLQSDCSIGEIAGRVGYPDSLYFSRVFKRRTGITPSDYRQSFD